MDVLESRVIPAQRHHLAGCYALMSRHASLHLSQAKAFLLSFIKLQAREVFVAVRGVEVWGFCICHTQATHRGPLLWLDFGPYAPEFGLAGQDQMFSHLKVYYAGRTNYVAAEASMGSSRSDHLRALGLKGLFYLRTSDRMIYAAGMQRDPVGDMTVRQFMQSWAEDQYDDDKEGR